MDEEHIDEPKKPGQYLAYEREKKGFTIEDIAGKLRLSPHVIRAIEEEVHDKLPELVYVRGYIRAYCRLLHIDAVPVLDMYTANLPQEEDSLLEDLSSNSPLNERHQKNIIFWGSVAVASIFLALIIGWWQENQPPTQSLSEQSVSSEDAISTSVNESPVSPEDAAPALVDEPPVSPEDAAPALVDEPPASPEDAAPTLVDEPPVSPEDAAPTLVDEPPVSPEDTAPTLMDEPPVSPEDTAPTLMDEPPVSPEDEAPTIMGETPISPDDTTEQSEIPDIPPQQETAQSPPANNDTMGETMSETINVPNDEIQPAASNTDADTELNDEQPNAVDDTSLPITLVVMSSGESWARVTDGNGDIFIERILSAGYNKIFMVNLPLKFRFGNAHQVSIMIDGKNYDISSYIKPNKVANFEVTELP